MDLWSATTDDLIATLNEAGLRRGYLITNASGELVASHPVLDRIAAAVRADDRDYRGHEGAFFEIGAESGHLLSAHVHATRRGQAAGGVRFWSYDTVEGFVRDGLRLSRAMGQKNALAGLHWGGGKGVIARRGGVDHRDPEVRRAVYRDYGRFITGLRGCYVTAEDVGTNVQDMAHVFETTRFTTCIPERVGGSGNPSLLTATGVVVAMEAALEWSGRGTLEGKTIAMQGVGNVASAMIDELLGRDVAQITACDVDERAITEARSRFEGAPLEVRLVDGDDRAILAEPCDVLAPNAVGGILEPRTIDTIRAPIVCGAANNQLADYDRDARLLHERGVIYVPDFLANRMGIVNCANEQYGNLSPDPAIRSHLERDHASGIFQRTQEVLRKAAASDKPAAIAASQLADELALEQHPIWGHRGQAIIDHLVAEGWDQRA